MLRSLTLGLCEEANSRSNPKPNSNRNPEVVQELNAWFCMELSGSLEIRRANVNDSCRDLPDKGYIIFVQL